MASLTVLMVALSVAAPPLLSSYSIPAFGSRSPLWTSACILACWIVGLLVYSIVLYPIFFTPFKHLPVPHGRSLWNGHFALLRKPYEGYHLARWAKKYPNNSLIRFYTLLNKEVLLATSERAVADILVNEVDDFEKIESVRYAMSKIAGRGLFLASGEEHKVQRKMLYPAFSARSIKNLHPIFWWVGMEMVKAIQESVQHLPEGEKIACMGEWSSRTTLDIMGLASMDLDFGSIKDPKNRLHQEYRRVFSSPAGLGFILSIMIGMFFPSLLGLLPTPQDRSMGSGNSYFESLAHGLLQEKKRKKKEASGVDDSKDMISILMNSGDLSDDFLTQQLRTLLAGGHESTASSFLWCIYALCKFPETQQRLRFEIRSHVPALDASDPSFAPDLDSLPYLNAFCNEVLRFWPPVPTTARVAVRDTSVDGIFIPKGTEIHIGHEAMNHSKEYWGLDAEEFNPERWMAPGCANTGGATTNFANMTFLHGPHNCIGVIFSKTEMVILVAIIVGYFEMELANPDANAELEREGFATLKPADGVPVKLKIVGGGW